MGWDELHTRVRQELGKRLDTQLSRVGLLPRQITLNQAAPRGLFFFSPEELSGRIRVMCDCLPTEVGAIIDEADQICRHRFPLLGYTSLDYGAEIDWHLDAVHGKRGPLKPWYKVDFLNFAETGDHKVIWELNRHQHLVTLAKAWALTGQDRYVSELTAQWYGWQQANPYPLGINWASSLEVGFRSLSWIWVRHLLTGCPALTDKFHADLLQGLALNGRHIERYLSTYFSPNTHLLGEAVALFFIGVLCPEIPEASGWRERGLRIVLQQADRQVRGDGVYFEQSLYYHVYALDFFLHTRILAQRNNIEIPTSFDQVIRKMLRVVEALSQEGSPDGFGDDDGGRLFSPRRNRAECMTDPLSIGSLLFLGDERVPSGATLTEEAVWLFGERAAALPRQRSSLLPGHSQCFREGGIYVSFSPSGASEQVVIDAGPQGAMRCGHGHADALSLKLSLGGEAWLTDPGTFSYMSERNTFRGTSAHNTLRVDGLDQAVPAGPFAWNQIPSVHADSWITGDTFTFFSGSHTGYMRLGDPVLHRRSIVHLYGSFCLVRDVAEGKADHELEIFWHLAPRLKFTRTGTAFVATGQDQSGSAKKLALVPLNAPEWTCEIGATQVSPAYGILQPAEVLRCSAKICLPAANAMIVRALAQEHENDPGTLVCTQTELRASLGATVYEYTEKQRGHVMIFAHPKEKDWEFRDFSSDASFLYCCSEGERVSQLIACQASYVRRRGEPLLAPGRMVERIEWWQRDGVPHVSSSDPESVVRFQGNALES